ncbi:MAG: universal stress protein [Bacteroidia bacterium]|nr:universal stress protein [Bacteroidia bacterium]
MKQIKNIIVATDFSATSRNAYRYAKLLANSLNATLTVVYIRESMMMVADSSLVPYTIVDDAEFINQLEELVVEENKTLQLAAIHNVKTKVGRGDVVDELVEISKEETTDLIVIGSTGLSDVLTKIFGSTSVSLSNLAHCPVLLIPRNAKWIAIERIMYASNYASLSPIMVSNIAEFALSTKADLYFVNVRNTESMIEDEPNQFDWEELFTVRNPNFYYEKETIYGNDIVNELIKYSTNKYIDVMCFVSNHRNFWQKLAHKSITENMAISSTIPMLVLHLDDNKYNA